jgi:hypothetical protein
MLAAHGASRARARVRHSAHWLRPERELNDLGRLSHFLRFDWPRVDLHGAVQAFECLL